MAQKETEWIRRLEDLVGVQKDDFLEYLVEKRGELIDGYSYGIFYRIIEGGFETIHPNRSFTSDADSLLLSRNVFNPRKGYFEGEVVIAPFEVGSPEYRHYLTLSEELLELLDE